MRKVTCKRTLFFILVCLGCFMSSCGTMNIYVNHNSTYSKSNPITINKSSDDKSGTLGELQFLLQSNGYKLMSYSAAKKSMNLDIQTQSNDLHGEISNTTTFKSVYVLGLNYTYYWDSFFYAYKNFSATITDLSTGEIIMTANFRGDKSCRSVLNELVAKMNSVIL